MDDVASQYFEEMEDYGQSSVKKPRHAKKCDLCGLNHRTGRKCQQTVRCIDHNWSLLGLYFLLCTTRSAAVGVGNCTQNIIWTQCNYRKTSNISRTLVGNKIVDNSDVVGASPVGAAPTTSSFSTEHLVSMD